MSCDNTALGLNPGLLFHIVADDCTMNDAIDKNGTLLARQPRNYVHKEIYFNDSMI